MRDLEWVIARFETERDQDFGYAFIVLARLVCRTERFETDELAQEGDGNHALGPADDERFEPAARAPVELSN